MSPASSAAPPGTLAAAPNAPAASCAAQPLPRPREALAIPAVRPTSRPAFGRARADIEACALTDALIDAEDAHAELQSRCNDLRGMKPATAALLFGSEAAWRQALARVGVAAGRQLGAVEALRRRLSATPDFSLDEIARPLDTGSRVQWTGD
ncbi:MAG TPA: hypothetical protein VH105_00670 [Burkholderiales bacterium]|jgi:hypothetical protein|nr:hypothetical protein [Burkholderiales bacterium]